MLDGHSPTISTVVVKRILKIVLFLLKFGFKTKQKKSEMIICPRLTPEMANCELFCEPNAFRLVR